MKRYSVIPILVLIACTETHEAQRKGQVSPGSEIMESPDAAHEIRGEFVSSMWGVRITNEGEEQILLGTEFYSVQVFSEDGEHLGSAVLGALGGDQTFRLMPKGRQQFIELSDHLRDSTGQFICKVFYINDLREEPKTLEFRFDVSE